MICDQRAIAIVFDDHQMFADSFSSLLLRLGVFQSVHSFNEEHDLTRFLIQHIRTPVYLFLDFYLKDTNTLYLIHEVKRLSRKTNVIVITSAINPLTVRNILSYNPNGIISKSSGFQTIPECLSMVSQRKQYICPIIQEFIAPENQSFQIPFSIRELEVLQHFAQGLSIAQTAEQMHLSKHTIVAHRRKMMTKAKVNSISELLAYGRKYQLI